MKKVISIIFITVIIFINFISHVFAADATKSAAQDLLERVATKVATLTSKLRMTYVGKVKSVGTTSYVVTTQEGDKTVTTNDVTSFYRLRASNRSEVNFTSLKVGDDLAALGTIDPQTGEMTAKQIIAKIKRYNIVGTISAIDKTIYTVSEINGPQTKIDLSDAVTLKLTNAKNQMLSAKMENFKEGDIVFAIAYIVDPDSDVFSVLKAAVLAK